MPEIPPPRVPTIKTRESISIWINSKEFSTRFKFFLYNNLELILTLYNKIRGYYSKPEEYLNSLVEYSKSTSNGQQKVAIVTGANSGIGAVTTKYLYKAGYYVILACRSKQKAEEFIDQIRENGADGHLKFIKFDGNSLKSVEEFVGEFGKLDKKIDLLVNNAGIMMCPHALTEDGIESQIGVNFVSHFFLTSSLIPYLNDPAKIINLTSLAAFFANKLDLTQILDESKYDPYDNYAQSKLANMLHAYYLNSKLSSRNVTVYTVHPGAVSTNLTHMNKALDSMKGVMDPLLKTAEAGTFTTLRCALLPPPANHETHSIYYAEENPFAPHFACLDNNSADELINWAKETVEAKGFKLNAI